MNNLLLKKQIVPSILVVVSTAIYFADYLFLGNFRDIASSFLGNIAFLPIYVLFITLMVDQVMRERERQSTLQKLNMVIGVFFSEVGNGLLKELSAYLEASDTFRRQLFVNASWQGEDFDKALDYVKSAEIKVQCAGCDIGALKGYLISRRSFLVGLLENQNLLEHEEFTDLLWAVFHLTEELEARNSFDDMPRTDIDHLNGDIKRVFGNLSRQWLLYMRHLKKDYPYLFSLAVRLNPMVDYPDPHVYG